MSTTSNDSPRRTYIHRLQDELRESEASREAMVAAALDLRRYLLSEKFWQDTTVQVSDVLYRLDQVLSER